MAYLDKAGLTYLWSKIVTALNGKASSSHGHAASEVSGLSTVAKTGKYSDLTNKPIVSAKNYTNGATWYYPLGQMVIDNSSNYGNYTFTGRLGGWTMGNAATYSIMLMNRGNYTGEDITATVSASGQVANALSICDIVVVKNSDKSNTVYLKCSGYFCFDFAWTAYQHSIIYDGTYSTTEPSGIVWRLSEAPKTILASDGSFTASGGISGLATVAKTGNYNDLSNRPTIPTIPSSLPANGGNADTVDGKHIVVSSSAPTVNNQSIITFVI